MRRAAVVLLLGGCAAAPPPEVSWPRVPAPYPSSGTRVVEGRLPPGPLPIDLATVLRLAGANNLDIAFVREKVREAYAREVLAQEWWWPTVGPQLTRSSHHGLTQETDGTFLDVDKHKLFAGVGARLGWEVGESLFATLAASQRVSESRAALEATQQDVLRDAGVTYFDLVREHLRARVAEESASVSERLATELEASVQAGRGYRGDVLRARVALANARLQVMRAREAAKGASVRLVSILRLEPTIELHPAEEVPALLALAPEGMAEEARLRLALERRPEIRAAVASLEAAREEKSGAVWGPIVPGVQVEAARGGLGGSLHELEGTADYRLTIGWRLGPGGVFDSGRLRLADARVRQAEIELERVRQVVADEVRAGSIALEAARERLDLAASEVRDAEEALGLDEERQARGIGLPLEVLQAEEALARARLDHYSSIVEYNQAQLRVFVATGAIRL